MLKIFNTLSRTKEEFKPINPSEVTMYNCGLTVYFYAHIGNLRAYTMGDSMRRSLEFLGYKVKQVQNFTDVGHMTLTEEQKLKVGLQEVNDTDNGEDRMEKAAKKEGKTVWEVAQFYIDSAMKDYTEMNFEEPFSRPRATEYIKEQIDMIKVLLDKGYAYITPSAIYFDTSKSDGYGELTGQNLNEKLVGFREDVEKDDNKRNPSDFRLWQLDQGDHAMKWESPWGEGFPGWHIECSAMSKALLGETIDIHTGGMDNMPVHHVNEIAQSEAVNEKKFVNYWYHNEFLTVDGKKMSKSLGNAYTLTDLKEKGFDAMDLRYLYFLVNFRMKQNFTFEALTSARSARLKLKEFVRGEYKDVKIDKENIYYKEFVSSLEDSFNMPEALATVWKLIGDEKVDKDMKVSLIKEFDKALGLRLFEEDRKSEENIDPDTKAKLEKLISKRNDAKKNKDYTLSDSIRDEVKSMGYDLIDSKEGTSFKKN